MARAITALAVTLERRLENQVAVELRLTTAIERLRRTPGDKVRLDEALLRARP